MRTHHPILRSAAAVLEGVDASRVALAAGVLVLLVLAWRRVRDVMVVAVVLGAMWVTNPGEEAAQAPPTVPADATPVVILA